MRNIFKYKQEVIIQDDNKKSEYLRKESVEYNSIVNIDLKNDCIMTKNKMSGTIYQFSFKVPLGLSERIDKENRRQLTQLLSSCNGKIKFWLLNEQKNMLDKNMSLLKQRINELKEKDTLSDVCVNRYMIMQTMEKVSYSTGYILVEEGIYKFEELASSFLNVHRLQKNELLDFIERINNDPLRGDRIVFE